MEKEGYNPEAKGLEITNLPQTTYPKGLIQTGHYRIDYYGCWWECIDQSNNSSIWMIGE